MRASRQRCSTVSPPRSTGRGSGSTPNVNSGVIPSVATAGGASEGQSATEPQAGLLDDVVDELRWTLSGRKGWLLGMVFNLVVALVVVGVERYDPHVSGDIKIANIGVAVVIYVLAGTVTTNQLGADGDRVVASLEHGDRVQRILGLKNLALVVLLLPIALLVSVIVRVLVERWRLFPNTAMYDTGAVFIWLALGNLVSVLLPYRPIALRARLKARRTWPRWLVRQAMPYLLYYLGAPLLVLLPTAILYYSRAFGPARSIAYPTIFLANSLIAWALGLWLASLYSERDRSAFLAAMRRPD